jgi:heme-degrading monooxygenase HmoA
MGSLVIFLGRMDVVMILEVAILNVKTGQEADFEVAFQSASSIIASMKGYMRHELRRCLETASQYVLLVEWETLEDHTVGFRGSEQYQEWRRLLHHFYDPFPKVEHYQSLINQPV